MVFKSVRMNNVLITIVNVYQHNLLFKLFNEYIFFLVSNLINFKKLIKLGYNFFVIEFFSIV